MVNGSSAVATLTVNAANNQLFDGYLGGPGTFENNLALAKNGGGNLTITRPSVAAGGTVVNGGILNFRSPFRSGAVTVNNGGTLLLAGGTNTFSSLTLSSGGALGVYLGAPSNPSNTVIKVNGNLTLAGTLLVQDLGNATPGSMLTVIDYTGTLNYQGMTTDPRSQWNVTVDTATPGKVKLTLTSKVPTIAFSSGNLMASNSLQLRLQGTVAGLLKTPVYYEVKTPDGKLWDFGAMPPSSSWSIDLRHLRSGTNTVRVYTLDPVGKLQQDTRQVVLTLGTNPPVRPRPYPAEIWWGGIGTSVPEFGLDQLSDPSKPWDYVKKYQDGFFLHGILPSAKTLAALAASMAPTLGRFGQEDGFYMGADLNFGKQTAIARNTTVDQLLSLGISLSFYSLDYNPHMEDWCSTWPNWTANQLLSSNMNCWRDFVTIMHTNWPGLKLGWTWSPVWFNCGGYPSLVSGGDALTLQLVRNGTTAWFKFDFMDFMQQAGAIAQTQDGYWGFASDCPYDYFAQWSSQSEQASNQTKILTYENWERTNGYFPTTICNYGSAKASDPNVWDQQFFSNSLEYLKLKQQLGGRTQKYLLESWYAGPYTWAPESNTNSFTGAVKNGIKYLKGIADTNGTLEQLNLTTLASLGTVQRLRLQNDGDIYCLPALAGQLGTVPGVTTRYFGTDGSEITSNILSAEGLSYTNLLQPGQGTNLIAVTLASGLSTATNDNASLEAFWNPQDPTGIVRSRGFFNAPLQPASLWTDTDIGSPGIAGGSALSGGTFTVLGSGGDIWGNADSFHLLWQTRSGNGTLTARVTSQLQADGWSKAGVMIREGSNPGARNAFVALTPANGVSFQYRSAVNAASSNAAIGGLAVPYWVRIIRSGATFTGQCSPDGVNWTTVGITTISGFASTALWGLAVTAHNDAFSNAATFDNVSTPNAAPVLNAISNQTIVAGQALSITNAATDADVPPQTLTYSLPVAPNGAAINAASGLLTWRPTMAQSPSTNAFSVTVSDNGVPPLSATQSFVVKVLRPTTPTLERVAFSNGVLSLGVSGDSGPDYVLAGTTNLTPPVVWHALDTNGAATVPFRFSIPTTNPGAHFYRLQLGP